MNAPHSPAKDQTPIRTAESTENAPAMTRTGKNKPYRLTKRVQERIARRWNKRQQDKSIAAAVATMPKLEPIEKLLLAQKIRSRATSEMLDILNTRMIPGFTAGFYGLDYERAKCRAIEAHQYCKAHLPAIKELTR